MLASLADLASRWLPALASGQACHRRALTAAARGDRAAAERWFGHAIARYRRDLAVEPLARLRVHELMLGARPGGGEPATDAAGLMVEIVRRLNRLDRLETLDFPHELADARSVLAAWVETHAVPGTARAASSAAA
ncbi:MAG TPA: hypothetical protein VN896_08265 [Methylomirabilota bacterium]|jgi:hypothetical protein|nr:hypothetical protein [Methylomirabilota bacterium]